MTDGSLSPELDRLGSTIDEHVGSRLRALRIAHGLAANTLAVTLGVAPVRVASWEEGVTRIPSLHLLALSQLMSCPLTAFFDGLPIKPADEDMERKQHAARFSRGSTAKH